MIFWGIWVDLKLLEIIVGTDASYSASGSNPGQRSGQSVFSVRETAEFPVSDLSSPVQELTRHFWMSRLDFSLR